MSIDLTRWAKPTLSVLVLALIPAACTRTTTAETETNISPFRGTFRDGTLLPPSRDSLTISLIRGRDSIVVGWATDDIRRELRDSEEVLVRRYESQSTVFGHSVRRTVDYVRHLEAIAERFEGDRRSFELSFADGLVDGWYLDRVTGQRDAIELDRTYPHLLNASSLDLVVRTMDLTRSGWVTQGYDGQNRAVIRLEAGVTGQLVEPGAIEPIALVEATGGGPPMTLLVGRDSRRLLGIWVQLDIGRLVYRVVEHRE
jgi:hypothetical protein